MRFCVVGAGAMGGVYGLSLIDAGYEVDFLDVNLDHIKSVKKDGFRISGIGGQRVQKVNISAHEMISSIAPMSFYSKRTRQGQNQLLILSRQCLSLMDG